MILAAGKIRLVFQPVLLLATGLALWLIFRNISFHGFFSSLRYLFESSFFGRCFEFYCGIFLALYIKKHGITFRQGKIPIWTSIGFGWIFLCIVFLAINAREISGADLNLGFETLINNFLLPPGIAILFYGLLIEASMVRKTLSSLLFVQLGKSSYVFYLIHVGPLFTLFYHILWQKPALVFIALQGVAYLLYCKLEKPLNHLIRRRFTSPPGPSEKPGK